MIADGKAIGEAFLEDYAYLCRGLIELADSRAELVADEMIAQFWDSENGGFYASSDRHEHLFGRNKPVFDNPLPSANSVALECLVLLGRATVADQGIKALMGWMHRVPNATEALYTVALRLVSPGGPPLQPVTETEFATVGDVAVSVEWNSEFRSGTVRLKIPTGWSVAADPASPSPLTITSTKSEIVVTSKLAAELTGVVDILFTAEGEAGTSSELVVEYQACSTTTCLMPMKRRFDLAF